MRTIGVMTTVVVVGLVAAGILTRTHAQTARSESGTHVVTLKVPDMLCGGCEVAVKMAATKVNGVKAVKTDADKRIAEVTFDASKTSAEAIAAAITKGAGFKTQVQKSAGDKK